MKTIEILLQGEAIPDIQVVVIEAKQAKAHHVIAKAAEHRKGPVEGEFFVFIEDEEAPLDPDCVLPEPSHGHPLRLHVHRCRAIAVAVTFNGETVNHRFGPGTTVETVKKWAALKGFHMTPQDAAEHALQISGTTTRPEPDTHIGTLAAAGECALRFDLVPLKRVEG
ncbi:MAG TPA: hypothetical protein VHE09_02070 [Rhizomicrobium sp.]|nr:hypothetical protein [Rhizomicrobium sp.]